VTSRLVLGCGTFGRRLALSLRERRDPLLVLDRDAGRVEGLRDEGIPAERAETTDTETVRQRAIDALETVETVVLGGDDPSENHTTARAAREAFPDAFLLAYTGRDPTPVDRADLREVADRVVDEGTATAETLRGRIDETGYRTRRLRRVLRSLEEPLAVLTHDNPDPDAIASAFALERIAETAGVDAEVCYYGEISHQENRAFVNLLGYAPTRLDAESDLDRFGSFALVDHSRPGVNDGLPPETEVAVVIDHHPPRAPVEARFVDLRSDVGATSTLLTNYLRDLGVEPDRDLATGLLFGIRVDTDDFSREVDPADFRAAAHLLVHADTAVLERIESPSMSTETMGAIATAIENRTIRDDVLVSCLGAITDRGALAQAADWLLDLEGVAVTFVFGFTGETDGGVVYASARARGSDLDLGEALRDAFAQVGSAGGHADMAGAQLPVGMIVDEEDENPAEVIEDVVTDRFFDALGVGPNRAATAVYAQGDYIGTAEDYRPGEPRDGNGERRADDRDTVDPRSDGSGRRSGGRDGDGWEGNEATDEGNEDDRDGGDDGAD
jgi:nanoRNase/pAp phosphatase (c-di-AMP/oligoRNAs hydrolase)